MSWERLTWSNGEGSLRRAMRDTLAQSAFHFLADDPSRKPMWQTAENDAMVNQMRVRRYFGHENPIGKHVALGFSRLAQKK